MRSVFFLLPLFLQVMRGVLLLRIRGNTAYELLSYCFYCYVYDNTLVVMSVDMFHQKILQRIETTENWKLL